jgi:F0F1-type ATP synthase membrane subunit b/b'
MIIIFLIVVALLLSAIVGLCIRINSIVDSKDEEINIALKDNSRLMDQVLLLKNKINMLKIKSYKKAPVKKPSTVAPAKKTYTKKSSK